MIGRVHLVGAGPGDPGLITRRGLELLQRAEVVLHDRLVARELLDEIRADALVVDVGKRPGSRRHGQAWIDRQIVEHATAGRTVVRLKGGDPYVFGRGGEEAEACRRAGVPCEVVPGVTSAVAAPAAVGIPVTRRGVARSFASCTPMTRRGFDAEAVRRVAHADTVVIMMGRAALESVVATLIECGRSAGTPSAMIERGTMPGQRCVRGRLDEIVDRATHAGLSAPAVLVVGDVSSHGAGDRGGRRVVVTRPREAGRELVTAIRELGAEVIECPLIRIRTIAPDRPPARLDDYDAVVFTSRHGVRGFAAWLRAEGLDTRHLRGSVIAAVGPATAAELERIGVCPDVVPAVHRATHLADAVVARVRGPVLFPCGSRALEELPRRLAGAGIRVDPMLVYETLDAAPDPVVATRIRAGVDVILFHAPSAVRSFVRSGLPRGVAQVICIGPTTAAAARAAGLDPIVARTHADAGMLEALQEALA